MRVTFEPHQTVAVVVRGKTIMEFVLVFEDSLVEIACHSYVESEAATGNDVRVIETVVQANGLRSRIIAR